jgi:hypothetical protein
LPIAWLSSPPGFFAALIIGTMVPDWPLYVPVGPAYELTHSLIGIFTACLPIGIALTIFLDVALKRALFELLPDGLKGRLVDYRNAPSILRVKTLLLIVVALVLGAASHLLWDAFTHRDSWGVNLVPALGQTMFRFRGLDVTGYFALQHGCTLAGLPVFVLVFVNWYRNASVRDLPPTELSTNARLAWQCLLLGVPVASMVLTAVDCSMAGSYYDAFFALINGVTRTGFILLLLLAAYAIFFGMTKRHSGAAQ